MSYSTNSVVIGTLGMTNVDRNILMNKLNLGCAYEKPDGWWNVDKEDYGNHMVADVLDRLPFENDWIDFVLMNHVLQMFKYEELPIALKEVHRVMKPGAKLRIITPDMIKAIDMLTQDNADYFPISDALEHNITGKFARYLFWHGDTRCAFDYYSLAELLTKCGFKEIRHGHHGECELDSREAESIIVVCEK